MVSRSNQNNDWISLRLRDALASNSHPELLKALVESFPGSWFFTRGDGSFAYVNQRACDSLGYTRQELMSLTLFDVNPEMTPEVWNALLAVGPFNPSSMRTIHRRKDGGTYPVEAFGSRIILGEEDVAVSYVIDLSEDAQTRQSLDEKQHLLHSVVSNAPVGVWALDAQGRVQLAEGRTISLLGVDADATVGKTLFELFPQRPDMARAAERALNGEAIEGIATAEDFAFEYRYNPRRDPAGAIIGATGVITDITARRKIEQANLRLMTAFEQTDESVLLLDRAGCIEYANASFEHVVGNPKVPLLGSQWPTLLPPCEQDNQNRGAILLAIASGTAWRGTIRWIAESRRECILQASLSPLHDSEGRLSGFVAVTRDVTEQTQTEEKLRQIEKMDAVGQLAGGVAHDFNNLLQVILGNADLYLEQNKSAGPIREIIAEILDAGKRASALVKQLLSFSKNSGEPKTIALDILVDRILPLLRRLLGEHIRIEVGHSGDGFDVWGDESQMEQVLVNLCVNARDAMPEGGDLLIRLSKCIVSQEDAAAQGLAKSGSYVVLEVVDTGCGMTDDVRRHIFEPFFTTKEPGRGTGLGLATVYAVAKRHGGAVDVSSIVGTGTRFRVLLCQSELEEVVLLSRVSLAPVAAPSLRILLAENDISVRNVTHRFLAAEGHEVIAVGDGEEAISRINTEWAAFDLLVLDAIMPRVNGPEVYRAFRALSNAPVLFVTGHDFNVLKTLPSDKSRGLLQKPFRATELVAAIARLVN